MTSYRRTEAGAKLEVILTRDRNRLWCCKRQPITLGSTYTVRDGWAFSMWHRDRKDVLVISYRGQNRYECTIAAHRQTLLLLPDGVIAPVTLSPRHRELARLISPVIAQRPWHGGRVVTRVVYREHTLNGHTFKTTVGTRNSFSDASLEERGSDGEGKMSMLCVGGTYLVRVSRHLDGTIFDVEVLVQPDFDQDRLLHELDTLE